MEAMFEPTAQPSKGTFFPTQPSDLRSPCPMINCLANHGYLPRDGRNVHYNELYDAVSRVGLGRVLAFGFVSLTFQEYHPKSPHTKPGQSWLKRVASGVLAHINGLRRASQTDSMGRPVVDLDELARPGVIEHDISLTRRDHQQAQGNNALQKDLVDALLDASADGKFVTRRDLAEYRKRRIAVQKDENPDARYESFDHLLACGEISLILGILGDGDKVPVPYLRAFLVEERLPLQEGWKPRRWWKLGFVELQIYILKVWRLVGVGG